MPGSPFKLSFPGHQLSKVMFYDSFSKDLRQDGGRSELCESVGRICPRRNPDEVVDFHFLVRFSNCSKVYHESLPFSCSGGVLRYDSREAYVIGVQLEG